MKNEKRNILIISFLLLFIGLFMIYSSSNIWAIYKFNNRYHYLIYQLIFMFIGLILFLIILKIDLNKIKNNINIFLLLGVILLVLVLVPGIGVLRNGSRSWFKIGPFGFQPSEICKILLIIYTSKYLEKYHSKVNNIKDYLVPILLVLFIFIFLIMLEPDFGSSVVIILTIALMIYVCGLNNKIIVYSLVMSLFLVSGIIIAAPYRVLRIVSFLNPWKDPLGSGYQIIQSLYAISPGGLFGHGLFLSRQKQFYLPEPQTDFIFSILCEELGFIMALAVIILFLKLFYNIYKLSVKEKNIFNKLLLFGIGSLIMVQSLINLSVVVGNIPVTGVTLPFLSYGGSSLISTFILIGITINICNQNK